MSKSERIIQLLKKIENDIKYYNREYLIGMFELDDELYEEVICLARDLINRDKYLLKEEKNAIISVALVNFAIKDYQNGQFWHEVAEKLNIDVYEVMKVCKKAFETYCIKKGLYFHIGHKNKGYVTSILVHAIIPNSSLVKFIEFLQDLYFKDLEEDYIDQEVEELIQYMHRLFSKYLEDEDINLIVQGSKMTIARQQLPKSFRIAFVKSPSIVVPIIERLLFYTNQKNYGELIEYLEKNRFDFFFSKYEYSNKDTISNGSKKQKQDGIIKRFHTAQYYYEDTNIYLQLPRQIIESDFVDKELFVEVLFNDQVEIVERLLLIKSRLLFKTEQITIHIPRFNNKISYRIMSGDTVIYSSQAVLFREFIIFDLQGNEINPKKLTDEPVKIITQLEDDVLTDDAEIIVEYYSNYRITTAYLNEESVLLINDKVITTNTAAVKNEIDRSFIYKGVRIEDGFKVYQVYSKVPSIIIRVPFRKSEEDYIVSLNKQNYLMTEISNIEMKDIYDGSGDLLAKINFFDSAIKCNIPIHLEIREKGSNRVYLEEDFIVLKCLKYEFDKNYYYNEKEAKIIELECKGIQFTTKYKLPMTINIKKNKELRKEILIDNKKYYFVIEVPVLSWRFGNIDSGMKYSDNIWWENLGDYTLYIKFPNEPSKLYIVTSQGCEKIQGKLIRDEYKFSLHYLFQVTKQEPITLGVRIGNNDELITTIHFEPCIKNFLISYYDNRHLISGLYGSWYFLGKGKLFVDVIYSANSMVIKKYELDQLDNLIDRDIELYYGEHEIEIYQIEEDDFFGETASKKVLLHEKFIVGDPVIVKCKNKILKGKKCISDSIEFDIRNFYLKDVKFAKKRGYYEATGLYYIRDRNTGKEREWFFTRYNPFILKPINIETNELSFEIVDRDEDGLIYDIKTSHINPKEENGDESRYKLIDSVIFEIMN